MLDGKAKENEVARLIRFKKSDVDLWMDGNKKEAVDVSRSAKLILKTVRTPALADPHACTQK